MLLCLFLEIAESFLLRNKQWLKTGIIEILSKVFFVRSLVECFQLLKTLFLRGVWQIVRLFFHYPLWLLQGQDSREIFLYRFGVSSP